MFLFTSTLYLSLIFSYQLKDSVMPVCLSYLSLLLCLGFHKEYSFVAALTLNNYFIIYDH